MSINFELKNIKKEYKFNIKKEYIIILIFIFKTKLGKKLKKNIFKSARIFLITCKFLINIQSKIRNLYLYLSLSLLSL